MSDARIEAAKQYYERIDANDYEPLFELFSDRITYDRPGLEPISGIEEFRDYYLNSHDLDGEHKITNAVSDGDVVFVQGEFEGSKGEEEISVSFVDVFEFTDGDEIEYRKSYNDLLEQI